MTAPDPAAAPAAAFDVIVIGGGPAGHRAALTGAAAGRRIALVEQEREVGGACVALGTIPSKTLRETALALTSVRRKTGDVFHIEGREDLQVRALMQRLDQVVSAHEHFMGRQLGQAGVTVVHGRARFVTPREVEVRTIAGAAPRLTAPVVIIATGSRPRSPKEVPVDHEHILDSDSILSMTYLPRSLVVLGAGVIASEYASIFAALGVQVTMIDKGPRPVAFVEPALTAEFVRGFEALGGRFLGGRTTKSVAWNGIDAVRVVLDDGRELLADKVLCALGRVANIEGLALENAGLAPSERGLVVVDARCRTAVPGIYAAGDVIGPPSLAASSMEQGRRAMCDALGIDPGPGADLIPTGVYSIPEMGSVGLTEARARELHGGAMVGRASFAEIARGHIGAIADGLLLLVADPQGVRLLGAHAVGEGAAELVGLGQVAIQSGWRIDQLIESVFNFPTLAEAYRVAALDIAGRRPPKPDAP
ncbi:MAG: Si-specific NAD(P)(+) transhydrogenase [Myxococcota bacterium]